MPRRSDRCGEPLAISAKDGKRLAEYHLDTPPRFAAMAASDSGLYMATTAGDVICFADKWLANANQYSSTTSPPARVVNARQVVNSMSSDTNLAEPSVKRTCTPPG